VVTQPLLGEVSTAQKAARRVLLDHASMQFAPHQPHDAPLIRRSTLEGQARYGKSLRRVHVDAVKPF
jgi:hypothetical protein